MEEHKPYRHELKYSVSYMDYLTIRNRIRNLMKPDPHTGPDGKYRIRSIYFDNVDDKALKEKIAGVAKREKFRIRFTCYGNSRDLDHFLQFTGIFSDPFFVIRTFVYTAFLFQHHRSDDGNHK